MGIRMGKRKTLTECTDEEIFQDMDELEKICREEHYNLNIKNFCLMQIETLQEVIRLRKGLRFYSDRKNYFELIDPQEVEGFIERKNRRLSGWGVIELPARTKIMRDQGRIARDILNNT